MNYDDVLFKKHCKMLKRISDYCDYVVQNFNICTTLSLNFLKWLRLLRLLGYQKRI